MAWVRRAKTALLGCGAVYLTLVACSGSKFDSASASGGAGTAGSKSRGGSDAGGTDTSGGNAAAGTGATAGAVAIGGVAAGGNGSGGNANQPSGGRPMPEAGAAQGGAGTGEPPISLDGLVYWFKADAGVHLDGGAVALWEDQSGNGYDATQSMTDLRPTKAVANTLPLPIVAFDGADDYLNLPTFKPPLSTGLSFFIVAGRSQTSDCRGMLELSNGPEIDDISFDTVGNSFQFEVQAGLNERSAATG